MVVVNLTKEDVLSLKDKVSASSFNALIRADRVWTQQESNSNCIDIWGVWNYEHDLVTSIRSDVYMG